MAIWMQTDDVEVDVDAFAANSVFFQATQNSTCAYLYIYECMCVCL